MNLSQAVTEVWSGHTDGAGGQMCGWRDGPTDGLMG